MVLGHIIDRQEVNVPREQTDRQWHQIQLTTHSTHRAQRCAHVHTEHTKVHTYTQSTHEYTRAHSAHSHHTCTHANTAHIAHTTHQRRPCLPRLSVHTCTHMYKSKHTYACTTRHINSNDKQPHGPKPQPNTRTHSTQST